MARQPILDSNKITIGYELLFRDGPNNSFPNIDPEVATNKLLSDHFISASYNILGNKLGFVNFPYQSLINQIPTLFSKDKLVVEVLESCQPTDELFAALQKLFQQGYLIALDDFIPSPEWTRFLPLVSFIKLDLRCTSIEDAAIFIKKVNNYTKKTKHDIAFLAEKVETYEEFEQAKTVGFSYFQGYFFSRPELLQGRILKSSFVTLIRLCRAISQHPINFDEVERIISLDLTLSYKLLTFVNASSIASVEITSFRQALVYLGEEQLRKFVSLVAVASTHGAKPDSLYFLSLQRAYFCDYLYSLIDKKQNRSQAFLTGMFSLLDSLLDQPIQELIDNMMIENEIKKALISKEGVLGNLLSLAIAYEQADWETITNIRQQLNIDADVLVIAYNQALDWSSKLLNNKAASNTSD